MKFGLITNLTKPEAVRLAQELCVWGEERGVPFLLYPEEAQVLKQPSLPLLARGMYSTITCANISP